MDRIELTIFRNLVNNKEFLQKAFPFLKSEYFQSATDKIVFDHISKYISTYSTTPTMEALVLSLQNDLTIPEKVYTDAVETVYELEPVVGTQNDWLLKETEKFCQEKAIYNAIARGIKIIDGTDKELKPDALPSLLTEALGVCFDSNIGSDLFDNAEDRYEYYNRQLEKIPFDIEYFNRITDGGLPKKTLSVILAPMNAGKSLVMCHMAASFVAAGKNVLYISMEMSEEVTSSRIEANLMNMDISDVKRLSKEKFLDRINKIKGKTHGRFIVKEFPTSGAHVGHFKSLVNELKLKKGFKPDVIFIDYLNICLSQRVKGANANSYTIVKSISEEIRGLAVELDLPIVSATQTTRSGVGASDLDMTDVSESIGLAATVDMLLGLIRTPELDEQNQLMFKLLKSRFVDAASFGAFLVGVERSKMKLYDLERSAQDNVMQPIGQRNQPKMPEDTPQPQMFNGSSFKKLDVAGFKM